MQAVSLVSSLSIPGFQKLSIAQIGDVGKESANYRMMINESTGLEDRKLSLSGSINSHLGYEAVREVVYDVKDSKGLRFCVSLWHNVLTPLLH